MLLVSASALRHDHQRLTRDKVALRRAEKQRGADDEKFGNSCSFQWPQMYATGLSSGAYAGSYSRVRRPLLGRDEVTDQPTAMRAEAIPDHHDSEPWNYRVSFAPYSTVDPPPIRDIIGDEQGDRILRDAAGLKEDTILDSGRRARRQGHVVIHNVHLTDALRDALM